MHRLVTLIAALFLVTACSTQPKRIAPKPVIRSIAIVPATNPDEYKLENVTAAQFVVPLAATLAYVDSKGKAELFNAHLKPRQSSLAADFTAAVADRLRGYGYDVQVLDHVPRDPGDPDDVAYDRIATGADALLHVRFRQVGLYSPRGSLDYLPRVNASGRLIVKGLDDDPYDENIEYGVDARAGSTSGIAADPAFAYPAFDVVMSNLDGVRRVFDAAARSIAERMARQVRDAIR